MALICLLVLGIQHRGDWSIRLLWNKHNPSGHHDNVYMHVYYIYYICTCTPACIYEYMPGVFSIINVKTKHELEAGSFRSNHEICTFHVGYSLGCGFLSAESSPWHTLAYSLNKSHKKGLNLIANKYITVSWRIWSTILNQWLSSREQKYPTLGKPETHRLKSAKGDGIC